MPPSSTPFLPHLITRQRCNFIVELCFTSCMCGVTCWLMVSPWQHQHRLKYQKRHLQRNIVDIFTSYWPNFIWIWWIKTTDSLSCWVEFMLTIIIKIDGSSVISIISTKWAMRRSSCVYNHLLLTSAKQVLLWCHGPDLLIPGNPGGAFIFIIRWPRASVQNSCWKTNTLLYEQITLE